MLGHAFDKKVAGEKVFQIYKDIFCSELNENLKIYLFTQYF